MVSRRSTMVSRRSGALRSWRRIGASMLLVAGVLGVFAAQATGSDRASMRADTDISSNWAGYVVTGPGSTYSTASPSMSYSDVTGSWIEPRAICSGTPTSVALWVGLGGYSVTSQSLEQTGTSADCEADGTSRYYAWYELVPADAVSVRLKIDPGDLITSSVVVDGTDVLVQVIDRSRGTRFTRRLTMSSPDTTSAEWISEAPSECTSANNCHQLALTDFGQITFERTYTVGNGTSGTIISPDWIVSPISLVPATHRVFGAANTTDQGDDSAGATPVDLSADGSGFTVDWQSDPTAASGPSGASGS